MSIQKIAEVGQIDTDVAQTILNLMVKSIGTFVRNGRQVALELQIPGGDKYLVVSEKGYNIQDKNGIAENIESMMGSLSRRNLNEESRSSV